MQLSIRQKHSSYLAFLLALAIAGTASAWVLVRAAGPRPPSEDVLAIERDGFRYEFHRATGCEALFRTRTENGRVVFVNVLRDHERTAAACRRELAAKYGVADLSSLTCTDEDRDEIARLRALGYL